MSSISIKQLPLIEEVNTGDLFLIQTPSSSNTLDFKDLIIGLENTTFANTISTFNTNIEILSADVGSLSAKVDTNTDNIVIANDNISTNTLNIDINTTDIATNVTNIATNTTGIANNVTSIEDLSDSVDDLKVLNYPSLTPSLAAGQSTHTLPITINGISYVILLSATS
tara:strand:- start:684 stop:1190 length:507 start_codon:yes stop_codon:yes gene_type:complete